MLALLLLVLLILGVITVYVRSRFVNSKRHWANQTACEKLLLSVALAGVIQFLYVTILPGWFISVSIFGKGRFTETTMGNLIVGTVAIAVNLAIYFPFFYLLLDWLSQRQKNSS
jgi:hypothetical protein